MLPLGIQDFASLRSGGYTYVDKTQLIAAMLAKARYQFLSRPRRFGKSLLISTLQALFEGRRELFAGLWIEQHHDFVPHPVIHVDFGSLDFRDQSLSQALLDHFVQVGHIHGLQLSAHTAKNALRELIQGLSPAGRVVVLVDEYDKPITDFLEDPAQRKHNQDTLRGVYGLLKSMDAHLHFVLLAGVSKFGKLSLFSDLNNLLDISLDPQFAQLLGYTRPEIEAYFASQLHQAAQQLGLGQPQLWEALQRWYNGYSWDGVSRVYCPFSVLAFLARPQFRGYWYETGTPTLLIRLIQQQGIEPFYLESLEASDQLVSVADVENLDPISLMFQSGYLSIQRLEAGPQGSLYHLGYPNEEVRQAFSGQLLGQYLGDSGHRVASLGFRLARALQAHDWESFFATVNQTLASVPYQVFRAQESYFHSLMHLMLVSTGFPVHSEVSTHRGRMDTVVELEGRVVVLEFKVGGSPQEALQQIADKGYAQRFDQPVVRVGVVFDQEHRQVGAWAVG